MSVAPELSELLDLALTAALRAGDLLLDSVAERSSRLDLRASAQTKSSVTDLVTDADRASEELIVSLLLAGRPDDGLLGEEGSSRPGSSGVVWVIDPIDGTTNFVYGYPGFAVSIAAADRDGPLVGVVHDPLRGETFSAIRGGGARLNGAVLSTRSQTPPLAEALVATGFGYAAERRREQATLVARVLPMVRDIRRSGSAALDLCSLAAGRVDAYYEAGLGRWDSEAGLLVATETGHRATEVDGLITSSPTLVVAPDGLFDAFLALLRDDGPSA